MQIDLFAFKGRINLGGNVVVAAYDDETQTFSVAGVPVKFAMLFVSMLTDPAVFPRAAPQPGAPQPGAPPQPRPVVPPVPSAAPPSPMTAAPPPSPPPAPTAQPAPEPPAAAAPEPPPAASEPEPDPEPAEAAPAPEPEPAAPPPEPASDESPAELPPDVAAKFGGSGGNGADALMRDLSKAPNLRTVICVLQDHGVKTADELVSECLRLKPEVPFLQRVARLEERVRRTAQSLGIE